MSKTPNQNTSKVDASIHPFFSRPVQLCLSNCLKFYAQHNVFSLVAWHWLCATTKNFIEQKTTVVDKMESLSIFWANKDVCLRYMKYYICFGGNLIPTVFLPFVRPLNRKVVNHPSPKPEVHQVETVGLYRKIHVDRTQIFL